MSSNTKPNYEDFIDRCMYNGKEHIFFDETKALAYLMNEEHIFLNTRPYIENPWAEKENWKVSEKETIVAFVNCNDVFAWGCADAEEISVSEEVREGVTDDLHYLLKLYLDMGHWGVVKWCCIQRNEQPQNPVLKDMKLADMWDDEMENLPKNRYDNLIKENVTNMDRLLERRKW